MTDIDDEALAQAAYEAFWEPGPRENAWAKSGWRPAWEQVARAVIAAYQEQQRARGVVEVRADDLADYLHQRGSSQRRAEVTHRLFEAVDAALANPEDTNG